MAVGLVAQPQRPQVGGVARDHLLGLRRRVGPVALARVDDHQRVGRLVELGLRLERLLEATLRAVEIADLERLGAFVEQQGRDVGALLRLQLLERLVGLGLVAELALRVVDQPQPARVAGLALEETLRRGRAPPAAASSRGRSAASAEYTGSRFGSLSRASRNFASAVSVSCLPSASTPALNASSAGVNDGAEAAAAGRGAAAAAPTGASVNSRNVVSPNCGLTST